MAGFYYFVAEVGGGRLWRELGLDYAFDGPPAQIEVGPDVGPDGRSGMVFTRQSATRLPQPIVWEKSRCGRFWVGWHEPDPPGPEDLLKGISLTAAFNVRLRDEHDWLIPLVLPCRQRNLTRECGLPQIYRLAKEGDQQGQRGIAEEVTPEYVPLIEEAEQFWAVFKDESCPAIETERVLTFCVHLLQVSYRIGVDEVLALGLLDKQTAEGMVLAAIDAMERIKAEMPAELASVAEDAGLLPGEGN